MYINIKFNININILNKKILSPINILSPASVIIISTNINKCVRFKHYIDI